MAPVNVPMLVSVLEKMIENELAISEFYNACSRGQDDSVFWLELALMERKHAEYISRISEIVRSKPERFESGRPFNISALGTILSYVKRNTADVKEGRLTGSKRLHLALDIEKSVLETRYFEIVKSNDLEFLDLSSKITRETSDHRDTLKKKIEKG